MTEAALHRNVAAYLRLALKPPTVWSTLPAGGGGRIRGAQLKAAGLRKGLPDLLVIHPAPAYGGPIVVGLELKTKAGRISPAQREMMQAFLACRAHYILCRSLDEVKQALEFCKIPVRAWPA